jgi:hypothetical protein
VPYGGNGFTLLLSAVSRQRRLLAEAAQNAVPRNGAGAEGTNIYVCRDVPQADTGRRGSARLVLVNVKLEDLDASRRERLEWKLEQLIQSLDDLLPDVPQTTGRECGPVVSGRLGGWEEELRVAHLPAAQALEQMTIGGRPTTSAATGRGRILAVVAVGLLSLLGYWISLPGGKPHDVAADVPETLESPPKEAATGMGLQRVTPESAGKLSPHTARPPASVKKTQKPLTEVLGEWKGQQLTVGEAIGRLNAEWIKRQGASGSRSDGQNIADWLGDLWRYEPRADESNDVETDWAAAATYLKRLGEAAGSQDFAGDTGLAARVPAVRKRFDQDLLLALRKARDSQLVRNAARIFRYQTNDWNGKIDFLNEMALLDVAVSSAAGATKNEVPEAVEWRQIFTADSPGDAFAAIRNLGGENPQGPYLLAGDLQALLSRLDKLLAGELLLRIHRMELTLRGQKQGKSAEQTFRVLDLLHSEIVELEIDDRVYTLGSYPSGRGMMRLSPTREKLRSLLTMDATLERRRPSVKFTQFRKDNQDPTDSISLEFRDADGSNAEWIKRREEFRAQLKKFDQLLESVEAEAPGDVTGG